jgi:hypothetical protein
MFIYLGWWEHTLGICNFSFGAMHERYMAPQLVNVNMVEYKQWFSNMNLNGSWFFH